MAQLETGAVVAGRYRLERRLGEGATASTWAALDAVRGERVALKVLREVGLESTLLRELDLLGRFAHPHLPAVHDFGREPGGRCFYAARLIEGVALTELSPRGWGAIELVLHDVLDALSFLHRAGIRHGDLKPSNVLVDERGRGVLIDLGCASALGPVTEVSGTLAFLAPEVLAGGHADGRADLFAWGRTVAWLEAEAGGAPARLSDVAARCRLDDPAARPSSAEATLELLGVGDRSLSPAPAESSELYGRGPELARVSAALEAWAQGRPGPRALRIGGGAGMGRSRLLAWAKRQAQARGEVHEASARQGDPLRSLIERSLLERSAVGGASPPASGIEGALAALADLRGRGRRVAWVLDDVDLLDDAARRRVEAVLAALEPDDPLLFLCVLEGGADVSLGSGSLALEPLDRMAVASWARGRVDEERVDALFAHTGGHPATVRAALERVAAGEPLERAVSARDPTRLPALARAALAELAAAVELSVDALDPFALAAIARDGWVRVEAGRVALARQADARSAASGVEPRALRAIHERLAATAPHPADRVRHLVLAGRAREACELAAATEPGAGPTWRRAADALVAAVRLESESESDTESDTDADSDAGRDRLRVALSLQASRWLDAQGRSAEAAALLERLEPTTAVRLALGAALLRLERTEDALLALQPLLERQPTVAAAADLACRAHLKRGALAEAEALAERALPSARTERERALLEEDLGVARSYLGRADARASLEAAASRLVEGAPRDLVRVHSYLAIDAFRRGALGDARAGYERALAIAEAAGLDDQLAHVALNLGTVAHQAGEWGPALRAYQRAARLAAALGQRATLATLELDLAQLYADLGAFERAGAAEVRAHRLAAETDNGFLLGACASVRAQIALAKGDVRAADDAMDDAVARFEAAGADRERDEMRLLASERARLAGADAEEPLRPMDGRSLAGDLAVRVELARGRASAPAEARGRFEAASERALEGGFAALRAEAEAELASTWKALGAQALAERHRRAARESCERCAAALPEELRDVYWRHPRRASLRGAAGGAGLGRSSARGEPTGRERQLERLLALNRMLGSSLDSRDVLHQAMDAAIELTGAERGFLLLAGEGGALSVEVARNLDRERVSASHLEFSRSIAERAIAEGEPVVTVDASSDARFSAHESVHAMKLRSVVAVPIPSPDGVIGALYLDNRFARARFQEVDADLLMSFADQVAIALRNARVHEELRRRTQELEREQARVLALTRGQAREIERLSVQLAERQDELKRRYDYGALVARSPAMQPVLATLDRVIASPLTVLVQGESGVGKELVARAVHFNGPRKDGPFVTVNCAALPDALLESELFGHVRGAFTGADRDREGLMVSASGGTLFLDEVGDTSLTMQAKLLRAIELREVRPVGGASPLPVDFRLVCATNRDLRREVVNGTFREDLYYRIGVVEVTVPPLRQRLEDLPELARLIARQAATELSVPPPSFRADAMKYLLSQRWPGNVRQLGNVLRAALVMADGSELAEHHFAFAGARAIDGPAPDAAVHTRAERDARERARILEALEATDWNVTRAATRAGISRATMYRKLARYGLR